MQWYENLDTYSYLIFLLARVWHRIHRNTLAHVLNGDVHVPGPEASATILVPNWLNIYSPFRHELRCHFFQTKMFLAKTARRNHCPALHYRSNAAGIWKVNVKSSWAIIFSIDLALIECSIYMVYPWSHNFQPNSSLTLAEDENSAHWKLMVAQFVATCIMTIICRAISYFGLMFVWDTVSKPIFSLHLLKKGKNRPKEDEFERKSNLKQKFELSLLNSK